MAIPAYRRSHFDSGDEEPMGPLGNLADVMLVFAVGLMVALAASDPGANQRAGNQSAANQTATGASIEAGRELPEMPSGLGEAGSGYEAVGRVYRDPQSGRLILIDD